METEMNIKIFIVMLLLVILGSYYYTSSNMDLGSSDISKSEDSLYGKIIQIHDNRVDILAGDIVYIFEVDKNILKDYYIGEFVNISENKENVSISHAKYPTKEFDTMGNQIEELYGKIIKVKNDGSFIVESNSEAYEFESYDEKNLNYGKNVTVQYVVINGELRATRVLDEDAAKTIMVLGLERTTEGFLVVIGTDENGIKDRYTLNESSDIKLDISKLDIGCKVKVYEEYIDGDMGVSFIKEL